MHGPLERSNAIAGYLGLSARGPLENFAEYQHIVLIVAAARACNQHSLLDLHRTLAPHA